MLYVMVCVHLFCTSKDLSSVKYLLYCALTETSPIFSYTSAWSYNTEGKTSLRISRVETTVSLQNSFNVRKTTIYIKHICNYPKRNNPEILLGQRNVKLCYPTLQLLGTKGHYWFLKMNVDICNVFGRQWQTHICERKPAVSLQWTLTCL